MKSPGSTLVHVVDGSGHCVPGIARVWNDNGTIDFTVFTGPGAVAAMRGIKLELWQPEVEPVPLSWHHDCPNE